MAAAAAASTEELQPASASPAQTLADVLSRLPPRSLAVSRCVCTAWRAVIDGRGLLRRDLLPLSLAGIFINYLSDLARGAAELFSRPSSSWPKKLVVSRSRSYPPHMSVRDHCNGLLLLLDGNELSVLNPATGWRMAALPRYPRPAQAGTESFSQDMYLVFDPASSSSSSSSCFEVFMVPRVPFDCRRRRVEEEELDLFGNRTIDYGGERLQLQMDAALLGSRWPLSPCVLN